MKSRLSRLFAHRSWGLPISLLLVLVLAAIARLTFHLYHREYFSVLSAGEIVRSYLHGLRFDLYLVALANAPVMLVHILSGFVSKFRPALQRISSVGFVVLNLLAFLPLVGNAEYFHFTRRHVHRDVFSMGADVKAQWGHLLLDYPLIPFALLLIGVALYVMRPRLSWSRTPGRAPLSKVLPVALLWVLFALLGIRGGWQKRPLSETHAYVYESERQTNLVLNSFFTLVRSEEGSGIPEVFEKRLAEKPVEGVIPLPSAVHEPPLFDHERPPNVIVLVLESFALEYLNLETDEPSFAPFLSELCEQGVFFRQGFANGRRSIDLSPSILCGLPNLMDRPFVTSAFQGNRVVGIPEVLAPLGYHSAFFHGTENSSMYYDVFAERVGFQEYFGSDNYPYEGHHNGVWGIYDEEFLQFAVEKITAMPKPSFDLIFTLSSHPPYKVPDRYAGRFPKGELAIHESIGYSDFALRRFFESARKTDWFDNTLFILTADHAFKSSRPEYDDWLGAFRVPIVLFHPSIDLRKTVDDSKIVQHVDILKSVADFVGVENYPAAAYGESFFRAGSGGRAYNKLGSIYWQLEPDLLTRFDVTDSPMAYLHEGSWNLQKIDLRKPDVRPRFVDPVLMRFFREMKKNAWYPTLDD